MVLISNIWVLLFCIEGGCMSQEFLSNVSALHLLFYQPAHQPALDDFDEQQIDDDHTCQEEEVQRWQGCKAKGTGKWCKWEYDANTNDQNRRDCQGKAWATAQGITRCTNDKEHERLSG